MRGTDDGEQGNGAGQWGALLCGQADLLVHKSVKPLP